MKPITRAPRIYVVCPVRNATGDQTEAITRYVADLEDRGRQVYWPTRDTIQEDGTNGWQVCQQNREAIEWADEIHVWWEPTSQGSIFDLGMAFILRKPLRLANKFAIPEGKSFEKVWKRWQDVGP